MEPSTTVEPEVARLLQSGCALKVGTVGASARPEATRGWGLRVEDGGGRLRVLVAADERTTVENLDEGGRVAVTATEVDTLRSIQVKGRSLGVEAPDEDDLVAADRYREAFFAKVHEVDGTELELLARLVHGELVAFEMTVEEQYDQTPGPTAGRQL